MLVFVVHNHDAQRDRRRGRVEQARVRGGSPVVDGRSNGGRFALCKLLPNYPDIKVEIVIDYGLTDIVTE